MSKPSDPTLEELPDTAASMDYTWPDELEIDASEARMDHLWAAVDVFSEHLEDVPRRPFHPERHLEYVPTVIPKDAARLRALLDHYGIDAVADLGAGDLRVSLWLDRRGYDVVAYELNEYLVEAVEGRFDLGAVELRSRDYHEDFDQLVEAGRAVVCFGGTNELPYVPEEGLAVQGYWESGVTAWYDGEVVARW